MLHKSALLLHAPSHTRELLSSLVLSLFPLFRQLHFTYLEFNPLLVCASASSTASNLKIHIVDVAAKLDPSAHYLCATHWNLDCFPPPFGRELLPEERHIFEMDSKSGSSLKLVVLNKNARIWTMVAGGGASVIYSDTICDLGFASELANYGEYSGAPTESETFEYAKTIITLMLSSPSHPHGKVLVIGGGIANFTNVATTFGGIIRSIELFQDQLRQQGIRIFVRRGGPNYQEGLHNIRNTAKHLGIPLWAFGTELHMTAIVSIALGLKPLPQTDHTDLTTTAASCFASAATLPFVTVNLPAKAVLPLATAAAVEEHHVHSSELFNSSTTAIIWGLQEKVIQSMLDFDYVSRRSFPSVSAVVYPFRGAHILKFYFGSKEVIIPVFRTIGKAVEKFPEASVFLSFASLRSAIDVNMEALKFPQFKIISVIAEGIPERFTQLFNKSSRDAGVIVIGPASVGGIKPGCFRIGHTGGMLDNVMASKLYRSGSVAFVTRSGGMTNEMNNIIARNANGVYEGIHIGGDRFPGSTFLDHILRFDADPAVAIIVMLGEVGGLEEYSVCEALKANKILKPLIAWCIGTCSSHFTTTIQFGHANACANSDAETANVKNLALKAAGALVPTSFDEIDVFIKNVFDQLLSAGTIVPRPEVTPPSVPVDYQWARELGLIRKPTSFVTTICDERGNEPVYSGVPVTQVLEDKLGIGGTIGLLWFQRRLPPVVGQFIEMCLVLVADHGPAVCGAHNTIVTARAGKDLLSSLCSGLLTIGDRFGGAINGSAKLFYEAFSSQLAPIQFVEEMKQKGELILGIGHLVKSVTNPDTRVQKVVSFTKEALVSTPLLDYALEVEKITIAKKSNLILNVDGAIATAFIDMLLHTGLFTSQEIHECIEIGTLNAIFILGRTIGFMGHYLDQKRLKQGLYRHPWDDIAFFET